MPINVTDFTARARQLSALARRASSALAGLADFAELIATRLADLQARDVDPVVRAPSVALRAQLEELAAGLVPMFDALNRTLGPVAETCEAITLARASVSPTDN